MKHAKHPGNSVGMGDLPEPPPPVGAYRAVTIRGGLGFVSGQFPLADGKMITAREVQTSAELDQLRDAARLAALNVVAQIERALGTWQKFAGLCRVDGIIACPGNFTGHATVLDAASETFERLLGPILGSHSRSASSSPTLPGDAALELVVSFAVHQ
jgi:enamine deaminase RidA (YjgF/YER057c/UK114 family)